MAIRDENPSGDSGVAFDGVVGLEVWKSRQGNLMLKVRLSSGREESIPDSQIHENSELYIEHGKVMGSPGQLVVSTWIAEQKRLLDDGKRLVRARRRS